MEGISPRPIDFLLLWLWASGTDEGHPRANAIYAKQRPGNGNGMAPGILLENNLASPSLNQTWNTYGFLGMPYSISPWLIDLENISLSFREPSLLQEYKGHEDICTQPQNTHFFSEKELCLSLPPHSAGPIYGIPCRHSREKQGLSGQISAHPKEGT